MLDFCFMKTGRGTRFEEVVLFCSEVLLLIEWLSFFNFFTGYYLSENASCC